MKPAVAPKHAPHARRAPFALLVLGLLIGGMCALLALNTASAANEVQRHDVASRDQGVAADLVQLHNDQMASAAPANLAAAAAALGMVPAGNPAFLEIGPDGAVRVLGSPAAASYVPVAVPTPSKSKPKPKPTPTKTPAKSASKSDSKSASKSASTSASKSASKTASKSSTKTNHPHSQPSPTPTKPSPTPTPATTLPGGTR
jgi:hypothetical protein